MIFKSFLLAEPVEQKPIPLQKAAILKELGIKTMTPKVDRAIRVYMAHREADRKYMIKWRADTKGFTEANWDELTRRLLL